MGWGKNADGTQISVIRPFGAGENKKGVLWVVVVVGISGLV